MHGKIRISVEDVGLHLCHGITRGGGFRLQQGSPAKLSYFNHCLNIEYRRCEIFYLWTF